MYSVPLNANIDLRRFSARRPINFRFPLSFEETWEVKYSINGIGKFLLA